MSNTTQTNPLWEAILKYCGANAINVADSYYIKVTKDVGNSLDKLRQNTIASISAGIKASFAIASSILISSLVEASSQLAGAYGASTALNEINPAEQAVDKAQKEFKDLESKEKTLDPENDKDELNKLKTQKDNLKKQISEKNTALSNKSQKGNTKAQMIQSYAQAASIIPKSYQDAEQTKGRAITDVLSQLVNMLNSTYQKSNETLKSFFDLDYLGGLVALGQVQLR